MKKKRDPYLLKINDDVRRRASALAKVYAKRPEYEAFRITGEVMQTMALIRGLREYELECLPLDDDSTSTVQGS